ncbi:FAD-dependent oxidoreductase [Mesorhizobium sp.]|uniref:NAD(P)/FAD-dependent oxidoreductase n=1 Tax=Mesorhizobium sp. TaxID=1871066 RepID=UPI000FE9D5B7|nr:FAD-dependent oxidoreductase [Mesorhizobium sp.]RWM45509.1 MAG: hypothetical protein EOR76_20955 [Mesorhizobium sp.]RWM58171.1 MAG: hypothetical protein EOR79_14230 [Mesorhizobium sp.]RWM58664.1 MAG: hypothetical protein EOR78_06045 [Mesorhizobium sp.]TIO70037.1 MAG: hypothetical protein E5X85_07775 [Mesorhizobium sp.]TJV93926.1 MAG: hypothetical protein E5X84_00835 [Mesorhizobium sp.]
MSRPHHVIVGAGQSGANAAFAMRRAGFEGAITIVGAENHFPYERPPLSKDVLTGQDSQPPLFFSEARYDEKNIAIKLGQRVTAIDAASARLKTEEGASIPYDRLLIATGGRPRPLDFPGSESVVQLRDVDDAARLRASLKKGLRVACVGAGPIGLEVATAARALGCDVTVLEKSASIMGRCLPAEAAGWLRRRHDAQGIKIITGFSLVAFEAGQVVEASGDRIAADLVVAGTGMVPNIELGASAGAKLDRGIMVDTFGETSSPGIYAAGDVATFWHPLHASHLSWETWRHAMNHGIAVGKSMAGRREPYVEFPYFWTDQAGVRVQVVGAAAGSSSVRRGSESEDRFSIWYLDEENVVKGVVAVDAPREIKIAERLIQSGRPIDPMRIADLAFELRDLLR